jgi:hypothetical protein
MDDDDRVESDDQTVFSIVDCKSWEKLKVIIDDKLMTKVENLHCHVK